jgi:hypothetical protein
MLAQQFLRYSDYFRLRPNGPDMPPSNLGHAFEFYFLSDTTTRSYFAANVRAMVAMAVPALRDPLVVIVGEAALEMGLEAEGAGDYVPSAVILLCAEEVIDATAVNGVGRSHTGFV